MKMLPMKGMPPAVSHYTLKRLLTIETEPAQKSDQRYQRMAGHWQNLDLSHGNLKEKV